MRKNEQVVNDQQDAARMARAIGQSDAGAPELTQIWIEKAGAALSPEEARGLLRRQHALRAGKDRREANEAGALARSVSGAHDRRIYANLAQRKLRSSTHHAQASLRLSKAQS